MASSNKRARALAPTQSLSLGDYIDHAGDVEWDAIRPDDLKAISQSFAIVKNSDKTIKTGTVENALKLRKLFTREKLFDVIDAYENVVESRVQVLEVCEEDIQNAYKNENVEADERAKLLELANELKNTPNSDFDSKLMTVEVERKSSQDTYTREMEEAKRIYDESVFFAKEKLKKHTLITKSKEVIIKSYQCINDPLHDNIPEILTICYDLRKSKTIPK